MKTKLALALLSGLLATLAFPPIDLRLAGLIAWAPLFIALVRNPPSLRLGALLGVVQALALFLPQSWWIAVLLQRHAKAGFVEAVALLALAGALVAPWGAVFGAAAAALARRHGDLAFFALPFLATGLDVVREHLALGHAWLIPGMTQAQSSSRLIGVAEIGGVHLVSVTVLAFNVMASFVLELRSGRRDRFVIVVACALVLLAVTTVGRERQARAARPELTAQRLLASDATTPMTWGEGARCAIVQGGVPQEVKMRARREDEERRARGELALTRRALDEGAELVLWSESAFPGTPRHYPWVLETLRADLEAANAQAIIGTLLEAPAPPDAKQRLYTNSALLVDGSGAREHYDKRRLVPFGEYPPAPWFFGWFGRLVQLMGDFVPGTSSAPLPARVGPVGAFVCYEAVLPQCVRASVREGAQLLVNPTNDGWYVGTWMPEQHLRFNVLRAVESRRVLLRAANTGISAVIAPDGRIVARLDEGERGLLLASVPMLDGTTVYQRVGDAPLALAGALAMAWAAACAWRARRTPRPSDAGGPRDRLSTPENGEPAA